MRSVSCESLCASCAGGLLPGLKPESDRGWAPSPGVGSNGRPPWAPSQVPALVAGYCYFLLLIQHHCLIHMEAQVFVT